jgi:GxxExxY protein
MIGFHIQIKHRIMFRRKEKEEDPITSVKKTLQLDEETLDKFDEVVEMCRAVYIGLGKGFAESVYEQAVCIELQQRAIQYVSQETLPCMYKDRFVGNIRLDIILHSWLPFIFELKAVGSAIQTEERWQLIRYMSRKNVPYGAVVNFNQSVTKGLDISFVVCDEGKYYIYDIETGEGRLMKDARDSTQLTNPG